MTLDNLFSIANSLAMVAWLLLFLAPRWKWTQRIVLSGGVTLIFCGAYLTLLLAYAGSGEGDFWSLKGVMQLFTQPEAVLIGWLHYLAFDLFVGCWETIDAHKQGIRHLYILPCLGLTLMYGPVGLLAYWLLRYILTRKWQLQQYT